jgi:hypothetical protein
MGDFRRLPAALFLMLHLVVGMRPAVPSAAMQHSPYPMQPVVALATAAGQQADHGAHGIHGVPSSDDAAQAHAANDPPCHRVDAEGSAPDGAPASEHSSHHDAGCHGAPCCAPVMPHGQIRAIATRDVPAARQRPLVGAARVVFADGARRRPPATAPPTALNA